MKKVLSLFLLTGLLATIGCHYKKNAELLLELVKKYDLEREICFNSKGGSRCIGTVSDEHTHKDGRVVIQGTRFGDGSSGIAYGGFDMTTFPSLLKDIKGESDYDTKDKISDWIRDNSVELVWDDHDDNFRDRDTLAIFSEADSSIKDLELMGANLEEYQNQNLGEALSINYGLSVERSQEVARLITQYKKLSTKRSLTPTEKNYFSHELLGTDYEKALGSLTTGQDLDGLLEKAADINGTSPEAVSSILSEIFL